MESDQLKQRIKDMKIEIEEMKHQFKTNLDRRDNSLQFSKQANKNLKADYDLLEEKFAKHMKATNNTNQDQKEEIDRLLKKTSSLQIDVEDFDRKIKEMTKKFEDEMKQKLNDKESELKEAIKNHKELSEEYDKFKAEYKQKM